MPLTKMRARGSANINVASYENQQIEFEAEWHAGQGETVEQGIALLQETVQSALIAQAEPILAEMSPYKAAAWRARLGMPPVTITDDDEDLGAPDDEQDTRPFEAVHEPDF